MEKFPLIFKAMKPSAFKQSISGVTRGVGTRGKVKNLLFWPKSFLCHFFEPWKFSFHHSKIL